MKPPICKMAGCSLPKIKKSGNTTLYHPYCLDHQIQVNLGKHREEVVRQKESLEKAKETIKTGLNVDRFYKTSAWINFSRYVLLYYSDENLEVVCSTDPTLWYKITDSNMCVGHYLKVFDGNSTNFSIAFEFRNVGPQSRKENGSGGNMEVMARWIEDTHGHGTVEELNQIKRQAFKLDKYTLNEISKKYLALLNEELKRRTITNPWR